MAINYEDRVAVVTGGGAGLGRSHALFLASRGAKLVVNDLGGDVQGKGSGTSAADEVVAEIKTAGGTAVANYDSVASLEGGRAIIQTALDEFGRVDILINNAGNNIENSFRKMTMEEFRAVLDVHLMGAVHCTQAAWQHMLDQEYGRVIMTTSAAGLYGGHGLSNYAAAKIALVGLMNSLVLEGRKRGITVNAIAPMAMTRMSKDAMDDKTGPLLKPEFVTSIVALLASEAHTGSGDIISTGAGYYSKIGIVEGAGVYFGADAPPSPDDLAARFDDICDLSQAKPHGDAFSSVADAMRNVLRGLKS
ncbi:MAG TPA: serine/threonine protein kinase [Porticoccaceae bacterium]|nr:serine/threonine protein kinase [Porticoccaceae bacterium]